MNLSFASLTLVLTAATTACGGDPLDPGAGNDPGSGTNTLYVEGRITAEPRTSNAQDATNFTTEFSIRVGLNDIAVTTGTVTVESRFASTNLTYQPDGNLGHWVGTVGDYDEVYRLDIISGNDEVRGVVVDGPDLHHITAPTAGATLDSTIANMLEWDRDEAADIITFRGDKTDRITISDNGKYSIAPGSLDADKDNSKANTLELRRANRAVPAGAVPGSEVSVSVEQQLDVVALPNPAL